MTGEELERARLRREVEQRIRGGGDARPELRRAIAERRITRHEAERMLETSKEPELVRMFRELPLDQALRVWEAASESERAQLRPWLARKQGRLGGTRYGSRPIGILGLAHLGPARVAAPAVQ